MMNPDISETIFVGNSEMAMLMRSLDWSQTLLGSPEYWPQSLRSALSICLNSRFPIAIYWGQNCLLLYNDAWRPIVGDKHSWALGCPAREVWAEIWDDIGSELAGVLATGEGTFHKDDLLSMHRFGYTEECFFEYTFNPIQGESGVVEGVFNVVSETTYRVLNERRARLLQEVVAKTGLAKTAETSCELLLEAFQTDPLDIPFALLYLIDSDGKYARLCCSDKVAADELVSPTLIDLAVDDNPKGWPIALAARTAQPQAVTDLVSRFGSLHGSPWVEPPQEAMVLPITAPGYSKVSGVLVAVASPRRRLDDHYRNFFIQVAGQVAMVIVNAQTYEEERKRAAELAELDRAKTIFFSNISHEFRTPLTLMLGPLEEMLSRLDEPLPPTEREQLQMVQRNGLRLLKLVNTLLDFSRIEAGRVQATYEPTDLAAFTAELASVFRSAIEQAGLQFTIACEPLAEPVYVDREMWEKIVLNLLSNAFKFTFAGEITITLRQVQNWVELRVHDTGIGIPATNLPQLFERFYRVEGAQGRTQEGSGIGLALVQELVRLHSGQVQVESTENVGTTFTITIPVGVAHLPSNQIQPAHTLTSSALGAAPYVEEALRWLPEVSEIKQWGNEVSEQISVFSSTNSLSNSLTDSLSRFPPSSVVARILLVDDNADMRSYVQRLLLSQGYEVETAADGIAALARVQQQLPNLVLTDVMMPRLDGFGLLQELRSNPTTREIPIILLSARAGEEARIEGLEAGADDYLTKPFSARELLARVEANLNLAKLRQEATQQAQVLRQEAETAKQQAEAAYEHISQILECMTDAFVAFDRNWCYTYVNPAALQLLQKTSEELIGKNVWEMFPSEVNGVAYRELHRALEEQVSVSWEEFSELVQRWLEVRGYPSKEGIAVYFQDITERKQAEANLRKSEEKYRTLFQSIDEGFCIVEVIFDDHEKPIDYRFLVVNPAFEKQTGHKNVIGKTVREIVSQHEDAWFERYGKVALTGESIRVEDRSEGFHGWYEVHAFRVGDPHLRQVGILFNNITERKQAEAALRESMAILDTVNQATPTLIYVKDRQGRLVMANSATVRLVGQPETELIGKTTSEFLNREEAEPIMANDRRVMETGQVEVFEELVQVPEGTRTFLSTKSPYRDDQGNIIGLIGVSTDITERKQIERDRELVLQQEQAARQAAEQANRIKDEFLAVLSHELRSPLNPILGWAKLLQQGKLDEARTKQALATIERNAKLQVELIEDLLDVSRILQGKLSLTISPVSLASTIEAAIETVRLAAEAKSIAIKTKFDPTVGLISGDPTRLQQIIWNLLSNAVKFTPTDGRIVVQLQLVNQHAQITVSDTGKGISSDFLPHVFDYFRQADSATTRKFGGLGLGLAIVRHLVELHGGTIQADSLGEDMGATFTINLPLMPTQSTLHPNAQSSEPSLDLQGIQVLVVDDEIDTRDFVAFLLEQAGATVITAASAEEALTTLMRSKPDVLLSDIGMPNIDGYMFLRQVRALPPEQGGTIPAIALTAYAGELDYQQAKAAGFQQHIAKPVEPAQLIAEISHLIADLI